mmetsp:Transcript_74666/g.218764  ORF Transcript_74666/g.218764 Transcript_74666/m.218764 type:complete len:317 (+) Transcript_74666:382-1332(+)
MRRTMAAFLDLTARTSGVVDLDEASRWFTSAPPRTRAATAASEPRATWIRWWCSGVRPSESPALGSAANASSAWMSCAGSTGTLMNDVQNSSAASPSSAPGCLVPGLLGTLPLWPVAGLLGLALVGGLIASSLLPGLASSLLEGLLDFSLGAGGGGKAASSSTSILPPQAWLRKRKPMQSSSWEAATWALSTSMTPEFASTSPSRHSPGCSCQRHFTPGAGATMSRRTSFISASCPRLSWILGFARHSRRRFMTSEDRRCAAQWRAVQPSIGPRASISTRQSIRRLHIGTSPALLATTRGSRPVRGSGADGLPFWW